MGWFSHKNDNERFVLLVDIGSGSVGMAISKELEDTESPIIVWSNREYMLIKDVESEKHSLREINTTIINAFLRFGSEGLKFFRENYPHGKIDHIQLTICAPWTHTVTKTIKYNEEHPFKITDTLIAELTESANQKVLDSALEQSILSSNGLVTIETETIGVIANDYPLLSYQGVEAKNISLVHVTAVTHKKILETVAEAQSKVIPRTSITPHSFMYVYYDILRDMAPNTTEACLIDITSEATEMSILRDNLMLHTSHVPYGSYTIAREIAEIAKIPKEEAYAFLRGGETFILSKLNREQQEKIENVFALYREKLIELFTQTGDSLSIPKTMFLHTDTDSESFFKKQLALASRKSTQSDHSIHTITSEFLNPHKSNTGADTAILLSANYSRKNW